MVTPQIMTILAGLPGCGKTTLAKQIVDAYPNNVRINWDDIRKELFPGPEYKFSHKKEKLVKQISVQRVREAASKGLNVIIDNTNLTDSAIAKWTRLGGELAMAIEYYRLPTTLSECIYRDSLRTGRDHVGRPVIERMALENDLIDWGEKKIVIVDMDGTLADCSHRRVPKKNPCKGCEGSGKVSGYDEHLHIWSDKFVCQNCSGYGLESEGTDWDTFFRNDLIESDPPFPVIVEWVQALHEEYTVCIVSGRPDGRAGKASVRWLPKNNVPFDHIFMRREGDFRDDTIVKKEILEKLPKDQIAFAIDDRNRVVDMWRANGVKCYQVISREEGDF